MRVYVGQTRSRKLVARLRLMGFGETVVPDCYPPLRTPWFLDNGVFAHYKAGTQWNSKKFERILDRLHEDNIEPPDFIVLPDIIAGGMDSLRRSLDWSARIGRTLIPRYLAVQDGMPMRQVERILDIVEGVFVGGTLRWKIKTGRQWVQLAHQAGKPCHIARCGTFRRVRAAIRWHADSIDSSLPLWSEGNLLRFLQALEQDEQMELNVG